MNAIISFSTIKAFEEVFDKVHEVILLDNEEDVKRNGSETKYDHISFEGSYQAHRIGLYVSKVSGQDFVWSIAVNEAPFPYGLQMCSEYLDFTYLSIDGAFLAGLEYMQKYPLSVQKKEEGGKLQKYYNTVKENGEAVAQIELLMEHSSAPGETEIKH